MKYALIGCGRIATNHVRAAIGNDFQIVGVCDVVPERMEELLSRHGLAQDLSVRRYTDYEQLLQETAPDLVSIATESGLHALSLIHI